MNDKQKTTIQEGVSHYLEMLDYKGFQLPVTNDSEQYLSSLWRVFGRDEVTAEIDRQFAEIDRQLGS